MSEAGYKKQRREQAIKEERQRKMRNMIFGTVAVVAVIIVFVLLYQKSEQNRKNAAPPTSEEAFALESQPMLGKPEAPVTLVEFGDFKCPICQRFAGEVLPNLKKDYIDTGIVKMYFINFPFIGADSNTAAQATESVFRQKKEAVWPYIEAIFRNQQDEKKLWATADVLVDIARKENLGIDYDLLASDLKAGKYKSDVSDDYSIGKRAGVSGTPTIFMNGKEIPLETLFTYNQLKATIDGAKGAQ